jgi:hypothetical protein
VILVYIETANVRGRERERESAWTDDEATRRVDFSFRRA